MLKLITAAIANNYVLEYLKAGVHRLPFFVLARIGTGTVKCEEKYRKLTKKRKYFCQFQKFIKWKYLYVQRCEDGKIKALGNLFREILSTKNEKSGTKKGVFFLVPKSQTFTSTTL